MAHYETLQARTSIDEQSSVRDDDDKPASTFLPSQPHRWSDRIGNTNLALLLIGWLAIATAFTALAFLWAADETSPIWRDTVTADRAVMIVTISSAIIRSSIGIQAGILTAAIASLILEHCNISLESIALFSIVRALTVAPHNIVLSTMKVQQPFSTGVPIKVGVIVAVVITGVSQFASTILLSDFGLRAIENKPTTAEIKYSPSNYAFGLSPLLSKPHNYVRFAEYSEPPSIGEGFLDTGITYRAFLPFKSAAERSSLRTYDGPVPILDARVSCFRPKVDVSSLKRSNNSFWITGQVGLNEDYPILNVSQEYRSPYYQNFTYFTPVIAEKSETYYQINEVNAQTEWQTSVNILPFHRDHINLIPKSPLQEKIERQRFYSGTNAFLLLNTSGTSTQWREYFDKNDTNPSFWKFADNGVWTSTSPNGGGMLISFTLCISTSSSVDYRISLSSPSDGSEPVMNSTEASKSALRRQFGATQQSYPTLQRDILSLPDPSSWINIDIPKSKIETKAQSYVQYGISTGRDIPRYPNPKDKKDDTKSYGVFMISEYVNTLLVGFIAHPAHVALFQDILRTTENPALALQALLTVLSSMRYYDMIYAFTKSAPATWSFSTQVSAPIRWSGFVGLTIVLTVHFLLMIIFMGLFITSTSCSVISNPWQAVAQVVSEDTKQTIERVADMTEKEANARMGWNCPGSSARFRLARSGVDQRSEVGVI